jgi:multidrug efflux pump subunit AcrA (membrane-fusion protein)
MANPEQKIKIGMEGSAEISIEKVSHRGLLVPDMALVRREGKNFVYVVDGQVARATEVETGSSMEGWVEIRRGVRTKDQVVTRGVDQLKGGEEFIRVGT